MPTLEIDLTTLSLPEGADYYVLLDENIVHNNDIPSMAITDPSVITMHSHLLGSSVIDTDATVEYINGGYGTTHMVYDDQIVMESNGFSTFVDNASFSAEIETTLDSSNMPRTLVVPDTSPIVISSNSSVGDVVGETQHYEFIFESMSSTYDINDLSIMNMRIKFDNNINYIGGGLIRGTGNVLIYDSLGLLHQTITPAECNRTIMSDPNLSFVVTGLSEDETYTITLEEDVFEAAVNGQHPTNYIGNAEMLNIASFATDSYMMMCEIDVNYGDWVSIFNEGEYYADWGTGTFELYTTNDTRSSEVFYNNPVRLASFASSLNPLTTLQIKGNGVTSINLGGHPSLTTLEDFCFNDMSHSTMNLNNLTTVNLSGISNVTSMHRAFYTCISLTSLSLTDTSNVTDISSAFYMCRLLTSFPLIDTSSVTDMSYAWHSCHALTSFPVIDTSNVTYMTNTWSYCYLLTSSPLIDTSSVTDMSYAWYSCHALTSFPVIDTSSVTSMRHAWSSCTSLTSFPAIDTSNVTDMSYAWSNCTSLTSFPAIDTSNATYMTSTWYSCHSLTSFPAIDTSNATELTFAWAGCTSLVCLTNVDTTRCSEPPGGLFHNTPSLQQPDAATQNILSNPPGLDWTNANPCP
jgi:hypothetical protein